MSSRHDRHAAEHAPLIAALQAGDLAGADLARADALLASCADCADLFADLGTLRAAVRAMPAPPRRRDFRLTEEDAVRLRPSGWRRLVGWLAAPRSTVRPLAAGLATLGLAGLLVTAIPGLPVSDSPTMLSAPASQEAGEQYRAEMATNGPAATPRAGTLTAPTQPAATAEPGVAAPEVPAAEPSPDGSVAGAGGVNAGGPPSAAVDDAGRNAADASAFRGEQPGPNLVALASIVLLVAGLGLFAARWAARRSEA